MTRKFLKDHPVEILKPGIYRYDEIRAWFNEFLTNPEWGWLEKGGKAALNRTFGLQPGSMERRLDFGWIWPKEQPRFTKIIKQIAAGEIRPVRTGANKMAGMYVEDPKPPMITRREIKFTVSIKPLSEHTNRARSALTLTAQSLRMPDPALPDFKGIFKNVYRPKK